METQHYLHLFTWIYLKKKKGNDDEQWFFGEINVLYMVVYI
jgi:hypothetical protein